MYSVFRDTGHLNTYSEHSSASVSVVSQSRSGCPGCGGRYSQEILLLPRTPVNCSALWPNSLAARQCAKRPIKLRSCSGCGLTFNAQFDACVLEYDTKYDNSLDFSPAFQAYAEGLAAELVSAYDLRKKRIVEIGCGNGIFLKLLCKRGQSAGIGFDPSFPGDEDPVPGVELVRGYFGRAEADRGFDFLCCRHVLEHLEKPLEFLLELSEISVGSSGVTMYFEVPNAEFVLGGEGLWDIIYPHVSYFTETSLTNLFEHAGFNVLRAGKRFSDQFVFVEVRAPGGAALPIKQRRRQALSRGFQFSISDCRSHFARTVERWSACMAQLAAETGRPLAFWGAGAKGVSFLNLVPGAEKIPAVVDSNPRKQGMFVPGTGQQIASPGALGRLQPNVT